MLSSKKSGHHQETKRTYFKVGKKHLSLEEIRKPRSKEQIR